MASLERAVRAAREAEDTGEGMDDFAESGLASEADIVDVFTRQFAFGCEADDPMNSLAFASGLLPHGARLNTLFASDIGHWDVPDVRGRAARGVGAGGARSPRRGRVPRVRVRQRGPSDDRDEPVVLRRNRGRGGRAALPGSPASAATTGATASIASVDRGPAST